MVTLVESVMLEFTKASPDHLVTVLADNAEAPETATVAAVEPSYVKVLIPAP